MAGGNLIPQRMLYVDRTWLQTIFHVVQRHISDMERTLFLMLNPCPDVLPMMSLVEEKSFININVA